MKTFLSCLLVLATTLGLSAQTRRPGNPTDTSALSEAGAAAFLEQFRQAGLLSDFSFRFTLTHFPREGARQLYEGTLWGRWHPGAAWTRWEVPPSEEHPGTSYLMLNAPQPRLWSPHLVSSPEQPLMLEPVLPGVSFTPFELLTPFIHWPDAQYEGVQRVSGRPVHTFLVKAPEGDARYGDIQQVRLFIDADFYALLRTEVIGTEGQLLKTLSVGRFKRLDERWLAREMRLFDETTREESRLTLMAGALDLNLPESVFDPGSLTAPPTVPPAEAYESF